MAWQYVTLQPKHIGFSISKPWLSWTGLDSTTVPQHRLLPTQACPGTLVHVQYCPALSSPVGPVQSSPVSPVQSCWLCLVLSVLSALSSPVQHCMALPSADKFYPCYPIRCNSSQYMDIKHQIIIVLNYYILGNSESTKTN
jgi:hypothetical protein